MDMLQEKWSQGRCRIEDGIFFANDEYIPISGTPDDGYHTGPRVSIEALISAFPEFWTDLYSICEHSSLGWTVIGGEGACEGEGFIALVETESNRLKWILHLSEIERVREVEIAGDVVRARAEEYPFYRELTIPLDEPHRFIVQAWKRNPR